MEGVKCLSVWIDEFSIFLPRLLTDRSFRSLNFFSRSPIGFSCFVKQRQMRLLSDTWLWVRSLVKFSRPTRTILRDKAIAIAGRVTTTKNGEFSRVSCPVCLNILQAPNDADIRMTLAVHLSLWHAEDVKLQWDIMHNKKQSFIHLPSLVFGVGLALLCVSTKNQPRLLAFKRKRDSR